MRDVGLFLVLLLIMTFVRFCCAYVCVYVGSARAGGYGSSKFAIDCACINVNVWDREICSME